LAHSKSALKRWRQNEAHRETNKPVRTGARTATRKAHATIVAGTPEEAQAAIREAAGIVDRAAKHNVIHKNAASRHKSRMMRHLNKLVGAAPVAAAAPKKARKAPAKVGAKAGTTAKAKAKAAPKPRATASRAAAAAKKKA
jgi:small subunit ribosomal protein S20